MQNPKLCADQGRLALRVTLLIVDWRYTRRKHKRKQRESALCATLPFTVLGVLSNEQLREDVNSHNARHSKLGFSYGFNKRTHVIDILHNDFILF